MKFVSLSQLLGCPLFGSNSGLFAVPGVLSHLWGLKKKEGRKKRCEGRERRSRTRKHEREEEVVKRKKT